MKKFSLAILLFVSPAFAQQQPRAIDRISSALGQCIGAGELRIDEIADLKGEIKKDEALIESLKADLAKLQPKK
ncbi:MAG: hypothetical protein KGJ13_07710 [Patescibacteria group bacterium]|nr:hypothetical protein [Patescibacteria group bacterium]